MGLSSIAVKGCGSVSAAGWDVASLRNALAAGEPLPAQDVMRPGWPRMLRRRAVPALATRPQFFSHARLRRSSPITQYATAAALEALAEDWSRVQTGQLRLGIILTVLSGCVNYSRRFYDETLKDPATASPLVFPETVFNAPSSHLAALLGTSAINYTLVGDPGVFLTGLAMAADWLLERRIEACLIIGAEEPDWLTADAFRLFHRDVVMGDGAGAVYLVLGDDQKQGVHLEAITGVHSFVRGRTRAEAARSMRAELPPCCPDYLLCDGTQKIPRLDAVELKAWNDWTGARLSPKSILGEGLAASAAWQCVAAIDALQRGRYAAANISVVGCNQQAVGAHFVNTAFEKEKRSE